MTSTHSKTFASFLTAAAGLVCSLSATAHDIVLVPERGGVTVRYGHAQDWQVVDQRKLLEVQTFQTPGAPVEQLDALKPSRLNYLLAPSKLVAGQPFLVAARYDNGLWSRPKTTAGEKPKARNASRFMMPAADTVTNNLKFAKAISTAPTDEVLYKRTLGHVLELVPQKNPATLKAGEMLDVLVLLQGKPYTTNAAGIASVPLRAKGVHMLGVDVEKPNDGSLGDVAKAVGADKFVLVATFTFVR
jgi:uncharacterized GH25 family protein